MHQTQYYLRTPKLNLFSYLWGLKNKKRKIPEDSWNALLNNHLQESMNQFYFTVLEVAYLKTTGICTSAAVITTLKT